MTDVPAVGGPPVKDPFMDIPKSAPGSYNIMYHGAKGRSYLTRSCMNGKATPEGTPHAFKIDGIYRCAAAGDGKFCPFQDSGNGSGAGKTYPSCNKLSHLSEKPLLSVEIRPSGEVQYVITPPPVSPRHGLTKAPDLC